MNCKLIADHSRTGSALQPSPNQDTHCTSTCCKPGNSLSPADPWCRGQVVDYLVKAKQKKKTPVTKTMASDEPPPCSLSQRRKRQHNSNKAHRHNGDKAQPPARRCTKKHVKAHNGLLCCAVFGIQPCCDVGKKK